MKAAEELGLILSLKHKEPSVLEIGLPMTLKRQMLSFAIDVSHLVTEIDLLTKVMEIPTGIAQRSCQVLLKVQEELLGRSVSKVLASSMAKLKKVSIQSA